ncbi:hypothetical protein LCGC14_1165490 [marine sediment metagenome]|uniref:Uncharacterized protein n=1 Tax=marine sediment metagenome TaxID=412755 RepID=A0A0F9LRH0_9ZZZZ
MPQLNLTPLPLTDEDLDRLAEITERDIIQAQSFATKHLDPKYKNLLLAEIVLSPLEQVLEEARQIKKRVDSEMGELEENE